MWWNASFVVFNGFYQIGGYCMKNTIVTLQDQKRRGEKITMITAYDYSMAKLLDQTGVNCLLVGDSLGMVMLGYEDTVSVTMEDMIHHGAAVAKGTRDALVVVDMPFLSYHISVEEAVRNAGRLMREAHAQAVKLEGGSSVLNQVRAIVNSGIPVMGHLGLTPQSVHAFGGFKVQGNTVEQAEQILADANALEEAGAFALVLECVPRGLAKRITDEIAIPTIGIGAGVDTDGQVLVYQDALGMFEGFQPKFVKRFGDIGTQIKNGIMDYCDAVKANEFPTIEHSFKGSQELERLY